MPFTLGYDTKSRTQLYDLKVPGLLILEEYQESLKSRILVRFPATAQATIQCWNEVHNESFLVVIAIRSGYFTFAAQKAVEEEVRKTIIKKGTPVPRTFDPVAEIGAQVYGGGWGSSSWDGAGDVDPDQWSNEAAPEPSISYQWDDAAQANARKYAAEAAENTGWMTFDTDIAASHHCSQRYYASVHVDSQPSDGDFNELVHNLKNQFAGRFWYTWVPGKGLACLRIDSVDPYDEDWESKIGAAAACLKPIMIDATADTPPAESTAAVAEAAATNDGAAVSVFTTTAVVETADVVATVEVVAAVDVLATVTVVTNGKVVATVEHNHTVSGATAALTSDNAAEVTFTHNSPAPTATAATHTVANLEAIVAAAEAGATSLNAIDAETKTTNLNADAMSSIPVTQPLQEESAAQNHDPSSSNGLSAALLLELAKLDHHEFHTTDAVVRGGKILFEGVDYNERLFNPKEAKDTEPNPFHVTAEDIEFDDAEEEEEPEPNFEVTAEDIEFEDEDEDDVIDTDDEPSTSANATTADAQVAISNTVDAPAASGDVEATGPALLNIHIAFTVATDENPKFDDAKPASTPTASMEDKDKNTGATPVTTSTKDIKDTAPAVQASSADSAHVGGTGNAREPVAVAASGLTSVVAGALAGPENTTTEGDNDGTHDWELVGAEQSGA
ncbi:hypothetical protein Q8F55_007321 [Vanrija albida]|uniref:Uncharacterized protein n=1 Tax=Vanrija albida TaxID=181172 RepID=A0ABR3PZT2_9TREE